MLSLFVPTAGRAGVREQEKAIEGTQKQSLSMGLRMGLGLRDGVEE